MLKEFKEFLLKGNLIEIAVGLILALAFSAVVTSFVNDIVMQIVAAVFGQPDFSSLTIDIGDGRIRYGAFLNALIAFVIIGFVLFLILKAYNKAMEMAGKGPEADEDEEQLVLLREIRDALNRR
ncbi:MAG: large conductance mechanosensitive channel protein MscL [Acidimicrobiales bacterium]|nr:large conductance mechanosensitive channel protein MscL [Acidimicrobiales bacterium]